MKPVFFIINFRLFIDASGLENNAEFIEWSWRTKTADNLLEKNDNFDVTTTFLVFLTLLVLYYCIRWYRPKPKKRKLCKRLLSIVQCRRVSTV